MIRLNALSKELASLLSTTTVSELTFAEFANRLAPSHQLSCFHIPSSLLQPKTLTARHLEIALITIGGHRSVCVVAQSIDNSLKTYNSHYSDTAQSHSEYATELTRRNSGTYTALHLHTINQFTQYYITPHNTQ